MWCGQAIVGVHIAWCQAAMVHIAGCQAVVVHSGRLVEMPQTPLHSLGCLEVVDGIGHTVQAAASGNKDGDVADEDGGIVKADHI